MPKYMKYFLTIAGLIICGSFLLFLYNCITGLAGFAGSLNPTLEPWVFWSLLLAVGGTLGWGGAIAFLRPRPLLVHADPTAEELARFNQVLVQRLKRNKHLREAGVTVNDGTDLDQARAVLNEQANEEIRATAKRVFIGTAVSQNGRLDSLVVLFLVTRLAWRISKLYNHRPHYREMLNLYANIAATSFLAGSIDELGIDEYVRELMGPLVGGSAIGAVPGAQAVAGAITASVLSGSTNAMLTLRCGIVARNYTCLDLDKRGSMRKSASMEASKMFVSLSGETVTYVTKLLVKSTSGAVRKGTGKAVKGMGNVITGSFQTAGNGAKNVGKGIKDKTGSVGRKAAETGNKVNRKARETTRKAKEIVMETKRVAAQHVHSAKAEIRAMAKNAGKTKNAVEASAGSAFKDVDKTVRSAKDGAKRLLSRIPRIGKNK